MSKVRSVQGSAWSVAEGDCSPSGLSIVIGYSNGQELTLTGERTVVIAAPQPTAAILHNGADRARRLLSRAAR